LKDISGNGLSEGFAIVIGKAEMKTNRYINSGMCCNNMSREIQKLLTDLKIKKKVKS
jgi:hypothetical protein